MKFFSSAFHFLSFIRLFRAVFGSRAQWTINEFSTQFTTNFFFLLFSFYSFHKRMSSNLGQEMKSVWESSGHVRGEVEKGKSNQKEKKGKRNWTKIFQSKKRPDHAKVSFSYRKTSGGKVLNLIERLTSRNWRKKVSKVITEIKVYIYAMKNSKTWQLRTETAK